MIDCTYPLGPECYIKRLTEMDLADPSTGIHGIPLEVSTSVLIGHQLPQSEAEYQHFWLP